MNFVKRALPAMVFCRERERKTTTTTTTEKERENREKTHYE